MGLADLAVQWLNELIYIRETESGIFIPSIIRVDIDNLRFTATGSLMENYHVAGKIKAATYGVAGRTMSRRAARKATDARTLRQDLESKGITIKADSRATLLEEKPEAYKDVDRVIDVVEKAGISRKIARVRPLAVIKG